MNKTMILEKINKGFTLIEVMITLTIIVMLASICIPSFLSLLQNEQIENVKDIFVATLEFAQQAAFARDEIIILCGATVDNQCTTNLTEKIILKTSDQKILWQKKIPNLEQHIYWRSYPYYHNYLFFSSQRFRHADNASVWYCDNKHKPQWLIILSQFGHIRVTYPNKLGKLIDHGKVYECKN